jgi:glycosyltransferase involved in cell wall biosynthesis
MIGATLGHLTQLDYPADLRRIVVIADNCTDKTVEIATGCDGVTVLERHDIENAGKPSALNWAIKKLLAEATPVFDAVVIVDADTVVDKQFLSAMDRVFNTANTPFFAAQGWYKVLNPSENWRTALMAGALGLVHYVRPLAREYMGLSTGLKGNGMCFSRSVVEKLTWRPDSLTEDIELGLDLIEQCRSRVRFVPDAVVRAQMPTTDSASISQRRRWERGRYEIVTRRALPMLGRGIMRGDRVAIDAAADMITPPVAEQAALLVATGALIADVWLLGIREWWMPIVWLCAVAGFATYIIAGFRLSAAPPEAYRALFASPFYVAWKLVTVFKGWKPKSDKFVWVRTERAPLQSQRVGDDDHNPDSAEVSK